MSAVQDKPATTAENGATSNIKETVKAGLDTAKAGYEGAKELVADGYEKVSHKAHEVWDKAAGTTLNDVGSSVKQYVRHHPGRCLLIAAGAGLAVGLMLRGRRG